jgi:hypothetical protein
VIAESATAAGIIRSASNSDIVMYHHLCLADSPQLLSRFITGNYQDRAVRQLNHPGRRRPSELPLPAMEKTDRCGDPLRFYRFDAINGFLTSTEMKKEPSFHTVSRFVKTPAHRIELIGFHQPQSNGEVLNENSAITYLLRKKASPAIKPGISSYGVYIISDGKESTDCRQRR